MDGQAYKGHQGVGYATVFGDSNAINALALTAAAKSKASKKAGKGLEPSEVWHYYSGAMEQAWNNWADEGSKIMTEHGIDDVWNSSHPAAIKHRTDSSHLMTSEKNINQAQVLYDKAVQNISKSADKFTPEYIEKVKNFPLIPFDQISSGQYQFPVASFKEPVSVYNDFLVKSHNRLEKELEGKAPTDENLILATETYFNSPENAVNARAVKQRFFKLTPESKKYFEAEAERYGYDKSDAWKSLAIYDLRNMGVTKPVDIGEVALNYATTGPKSDSKTTTKEAGVLKSRSYKTLKKGAENELAQSHFAANMYQLNDQSAMAQLGVPMGLPIAERLQKATKALAEKIRARASTEYEGKDTKDMDSGLTEEQTTKSFNTWWSELNSGDDAVKQHAAKWLFGKDKTGRVVDAAVSGVLTGEAFVSDVAPEDIKIGPVVEINYKSIPKADAAKANALKELKKLSESQLSPESQIAYEQLIEFYESKSEGTTVVYPLNDEFKQVFKELHNQSSSSKKLGYKSEIDTDDFLNIGTDKKINW